MSGCHQRLDGPSVSSAIEQVNGSISVQVRGSRGCHRVMEMIKFNISGI